jgi:hypothetical protein
MEALKQIPEWLGATILGAVIAVVGYVAKLLLEYVGEMRTRRRVRRARLVELFSLLRAGKVAFDVQCDNRNKLADSIKTRNPALAASIKGYERLFVAAYPDMMEEEKELHSIIRAYTIYIIRPVNELILQWLKEDTYFKAQVGGNGPQSKLARRLARLEAHLLLWQAKYTIWIPDNPLHSLVYLADEKRHGLGFPIGIEDDVLEVIKPGSSREKENNGEAEKKEDGKYISYNAAPNNSFNRSA